MSSKKLNRKTKKLCCIVKPYSAKGQCEPCLIRSRKTYQYFKELAEGKTLYDILENVWALIDHRHGWKSLTNSEYALESLKLLNDDLKLDKRKFQEKKK